jgi:hypothetical protein
MQNKSDALVCVMELLTNVEPPPTPMFSWEIKQGKQPNN